MKLVMIAGECRADELLAGFCVVKAERFGLIDCEEAAVILGKGAESSAAAIRSALGVIVNGDEPCGQLPRGIALAACGASPKNTVSFTSRRESSITLSLNRSVRTAVGVAEPFEEPSEFPDGFSEYDIMAAFAARILLGG